MGILSGSIRAGWWGYRSESDPRWNVDGRAEAMSALFPPREAEAALEAKKREYGEPPADLTYSSMKD